MQPSGLLFSSNFEIWMGSPVRNYFVKASNLVDSLHGMELVLSQSAPYQQVQCCHRQPRRRDGKQWTRCEGRVHFKEETEEPYLIYLNPDAMQPDFTVVYEFGHLVHYAAIKAAESNRGNAVARLDDLIHWLRLSETSQRLALLSTKADELDAAMLLKVLLTGGPNTQPDMPLRSYIDDYLRSDPELIARGYAQWVAMSTGDAILSEQLDYWLSPALQQRLPEQWPREEV